MVSRTLAHLLLTVLLVFLLVSFVQAAELPRYSLGENVVHGRNPVPGKAGGDTINLMAAGDDPTNSPDEPAYRGDFENNIFQPDWQGWTSVDLTAPYALHWQVSEYQQTGGNHAAWCGDIDLPACGPGDPEGGYGNYWNDVIEFRRTVPDPGLNTTVTVTASLHHDSEPGYDYTYLSYQYENESFTNLQSWDGTGIVSVLESVTYQPQNYLDGTDVAVYFRFISEGAFSDEDCRFPSAGACQVDDINVRLVNGAVTEDFFEDFEGDGGPDDFGLWTVAPTIGVGDFAQIWTGLEDLDPCFSNYSPQVAFIDDGIVVPGTGGSECINWCYGPYGYIVNTTGGLAGYPEHIHNAIESPVMTWPGAVTPGDPDPDGIILAFTVYRHEDLSHDSPGIFFTWGVRSADSDGSAGPAQAITAQSWEDRNYVYYGGPDYHRALMDVTELMEQGRDEVQVQLAVYEIGWVWYYDGDDGYPAPYFDNVTVKVYPHEGPAMTARDIDLAQDAFPELGTLDTEELGDLHVRFDMANNNSAASELRNDPGDSILVRAVSVRAGADLVANPELHYVLKRNPGFDAYRTAGMPDIGWVSGGVATNGGFPHPGQWAFDLPDTGFLYPGDILHYYIKGVDAIGGLGGADPQTVLLPADTTGYATGFDDPRDYDPLFTMRALPSLHVDKDVFSPYELLFINDGAMGEDQNRWFDALAHHNGVYSHGYDVYHVNGPTSGVGNGIGGRANAELLSFYTDILYTSGSLETRTIANGDYNVDPGDDVGALAGWLDQGDKDLFLAGDGLAGDLDQSGADTGNFLGQYMGLTFTTSNVRPLISNQVAPRVQPVAGLPWGSIFPSDFSWIAYGGCPEINRFDGVEVTGLAVRQAEFLDPSGYGGMYPFAAVTLNEVATSRVVSMPLDLGSVYAVQGGSYLGYIDFLEFLLHFFDIYGVGHSSEDGALPNLVFRADNHPNPFNPNTIITYSLPRAGHFKLNVYDVRGHLVKTLVDGIRPAGADQTVVWDGSNSLGSAAASGVYFYEARAGGEVKIGKMTLLK